MMRGSNLSDCEVPPRIRKVSNEIRSLFISPTKMCRYVGLVEACMPSSRANINTSMSLSKHWCSKTFAKDKAGRLQIRHGNCVRNLGGMMHP